MAKGRLRFPRTEVRLTPNRMPPTLGARAMKRYTLVLQPRSDGADAVRLRAAIERRFLRSPVTFRLGQPAADGSGTVRLPIGSDSSRDDVVRYLRGLESDLPYALTGIEWGGPEAADGANAGGPSYWEVDDPYADEDAHDSDRREYRLGRQQAFTLAVSLGVPVIWGVYFVGRLAWDFDSVFLDVALPLLLWTSAIFTMAWPTRLIASVAVAPESLDLRYRFPPRTRRIGWPDIQGLDVAGTDLWLRTPGRAARFSIQGLGDPGGLIGAIVRRASLRFVEGRIGPALIYRRAEAP